MLARAQAWHPAGYKISLPGLGEAGYRNREYASIRLPAMSSEKATALVLRAIDFSETSVVVTLFTREFGKIRALAKGGRRPKGPFESALDLLALCRVVFLRKSSDALDLLTEAKLERRFRPPRGALSNLYGAYYVAELLNELTDEYDPHPDLFDAAEQSLAALSNTDAVAFAVLRFELTALRVLGHLPSLDRCVECGKTRGAIGANAIQPARRWSAVQIVSSGTKTSHFGQRGRAGGHGAAGVAARPTARHPPRSIRGPTANCARC